ncbi:hypothetical protein Tco_0255317 [Tanacetum coccineum]
MFKDNSYQAHDVHNDLYEALQKSLELDYTNQRLADQEEARKKRRKRRDVPRTPPGSPPSQPPPLPPPVGASGAPGTSRASGSSQLPPPPPPPLSIGTSGSAQYKSSGVFRTHELSPTDYLMQDDSIPKEQVLLSNDEDSENDHQPKANVRKDCWKPLPEEERPATPEPAWTIPSSNMSDVANNWASALATTYETPAENSLLAKIGDMTTFLKWYCRQVNKTTLTQADFEGQAYEVVKSFYPDVIHLQFQMEECHKMLTAQVDWTNPEGDHVRIDESNPALSISKMKAASYPYVGLELLKFYIDRHDSLSRRKDVRTHMQILSVVRIKAYSRYEYDYLSKIVLQRADFHEHTIVEKDFKNLYHSDFEDLNLLLLQGHLDHLPSSDKKMLSTALNLTKPGWDATGNEFKHDYTIIESPRAVVFPVNNNERKIMRFNKIYKFSDGMLTCILEALDYRVKEFKVKRLNPGMNTRFWTEKDVTRSKEFIAAIERRMKTRRIYQNLECFVGGRVRDIDYRLLQRTK